MLEVLAEANHPLTITTKSDRVLRDIDLLAPMAAKGLVGVAVSVTMLDPPCIGYWNHAHPAPQNALQP